jgi:rhodanese-related sulfurtransferase
VPDWSDRGKHPAMTKRVTPKEAAELMGQGWTYLDVRSIPEFEEAHPSDAANIPLLHARAGRMVPNPDFQKVVEANFPRDAKLVVGCKAGGRSAQAVGLLASLGYENLADVRGGFGGERDALGRQVVPGWTESGLPTAQGEASARPYSELEKNAPGT